MIHIILSYHYGGVLHVYQLPYFSGEFQLCRLSFPPFFFAFKVCLSSLTKVCTPVYGELLSGGYCRQLAGYIIFFLSHITFAPLCTQSAAFCFCFLSLLSRVPAFVVHVCRPLLLPSPNSVQLLLTSLPRFCSRIVIFCCQPLLILLSKLMSVYWRVFCSTFIASRPSLVPTAYTI